MCVTGAVRVYWHEPRAAPMPRILVVDDEEGLRNFLKRVLLLAGYDVQTASDAESAMRLCDLRKHQHLPAFNLVLSDIQMPSQDGYALARWIAAHHPSTRVALMSGDPGCNDCPSTERCPKLAKPFTSFTDILSFVSAVLEAPQS